MFDSLLDLAFTIAGKIGEAIADFGVSEDGVASLDALADSVTRVATDFKIPVPEVYAASGSYGEHLTNDPTTLLDDKIGADPRVVEMINFKYDHPHAYDVVTAHEMTHAQIGASGLRDHLTAKAEEVICDTKAGLYAGTHNLPREVFYGEIGGSPADSEHPAGAERSVFFEKAYDLAHNYPFHEFRPITSDISQMDKINGLFTDVLKTYNRA